MPKKAKQSISYVQSYQKNVMKTDFCQEVMEGHTNAIHLDRAYAQVPRLQQLGKGIAVGRTERGWQQGAPPGVGTSPLRACGSGSALVL